MKIGIVGSRSRDSIHSDFPLVKRAFLRIHDGHSIIVSGGCQQGGDRFAELIAKNEQVPIVIHYAQWRRFGKHAGLIRNTDIAIESEILIACVTEDRTGGTEDTIEKFLKWKSLDEKKAIETGKLILV